MSRINFDGPKDVRAIEVLLYLNSVECTLGKHASSNILKTLQPKKENFQIKVSDIFHISAQNIDCGTL